MFEEVLKNRRFGYQRVGSQTQKNNSSLEAQKQEFIRQGVPEKNIRTEVGSAADPIRERPGFQKLIEKELQSELIGEKRASKNSLRPLVLKQMKYLKAKEAFELQLQTLKMKKEKVHCTKTFLR